MGRTLQAGLDKIDGMGLHLFSNDELYMLHCATLEVLQHTGVKVISEDAREIFSAGGAIVDPVTKMVKIPPYMVEEAIRSAPGTILMAGRNPKNDYIIEGKKVGFLNFGEGLKIIDPVTREYRNTCKRDVADTARLCDALDGVVVHNRAVGADDMPGPVQSLHNAEAIFPNISKHCFVGGGSARNFRKIIEMAALIVGGRDKLRDRPIYSTIVCPTSPLQLTPDCCDNIIEAAQSGITVCILSMAMAGATSTVTLAGTLITHNAEVLGGIVLHQLVRKGAPVIYGSSTTMMDLKHTTAPVGCPESGMINAAVAKLAQFYLLPSFVSGG
jgi:trimethylamine---corrinoid protein Co-methyltransferase